MKDSLRKKENNCKEDSADLDIDYIEKVLDKFPLISVIVPVYNVRNYLIRCINSIQKQTYKNLEIILVDDGSTDGSSDLCDELGRKDSRIKVFHKLNSGQSGARNVGLGAAHGEFIGFVDSDDWIAPDMYAYMLNLIKSSHADIAQIGVKNTSRYRININKEKERIMIFQNKKILQHYMYDSTVSGSYSVCRCLFRRNVLQGFKFQEGKINEDIVYKYKALSCCKRYVESNLLKYFYFQSTGSTTTTGVRERDFDLYDASETLYQLTQKETYGTIAFLGKVKKARTAFSLLCKIAYYGILDVSIDRKKIVRKLTVEHRKNLMILLLSPMKNSRKLVAIGLAVHIKMVELPIGIWKRLKCLV